MRGIVAAFVIAAVATAFAAETATAQAPRGTRRDQPPESKPAAQPHAAQPVDEAASEVPEIVQDPNKVQKLNAILEQWEEKSTSISQLDTTFRRVDINRPYKTKTVYEGRALLKAPNLACLNIEKVDPNPNAQVKKKFHERILCTGEDVVQYDGPTKQIVVYPLDKGQKQRALQQGPLPFLFDMKAAAVKKRYLMELVGEQPNSFRIKITPKEEIDREAFAEALLDLNRETFLPDDLMLTSPNEKETQTYHFGSIKTNVKIAQVNFVLNKPEGWKVVRNPDPGAKPTRVGIPRPVGAPDVDPRDALQRPRTGARSR